MSYFWADSAEHEFTGIHCWVTKVRETMKISFSGFYAVEKKRIFSWRFRTLKTQAPCADETSGRNNLSRGFKSPKNASDSNSNLQTVL